MTDFLDSFAERGSPEEPTAAGKSPKELTKPKEIKRERKNNKDGLVSSVKRNPPEESIAALRKSKAKLKEKKHDRSRLKEMSKSGKSNSRDKASPNEDKLSEVLQPKIKQKVTQSAGKPSQKKSQSKKKLRKKKKGIKEDETQ